MVQRRGRRNGGPSAERTAMDLSRRKFIVAGTAVAAAGAAAGPGRAEAAESAALSSGGGQQALRGMWLAGDTHVHDDHSSDGSLPRQLSRQTSPGNLPVGDQIGQAER